MKNIIWDNGRVELYESDWDGEEWNDSTSVIAPSALIKHLWEEIELKNKVTPRDLLGAMDALPDAWQTILGEPLLTDLLKEEREGGTPAGFDYLEIVRGAERHKHSDGLSFEIGLDITGIKEDAEKEEDRAMGIGFCPLRNLIDTPIRMDPKVVLWDYTRKNPKECRIPLGNMVFTVFDLFKAFVYEITWYGVGGDREETHDGIVEEVDKYRTALENGTLVFKEDEDLRRLQEEDEAISRAPLPNGEEIIAVENPTNEEENDN